MKLCSITSGSSGNCIFIGSEHTSLLIDVGLSGKRLELGLNEIDRKTEDIAGILITHEHSDHIKGLGVVARRSKIPIYATGGTISEIMGSGSMGKIPTGIFREICAAEEYTIGDLAVKPFTISHDAAKPVGYRIENDGKAVAVATDMGHYTDYIVENLSGLDALLLESNHDVNMLQVGRYPYYLKRRILSDWGHLSNEAAGQLLCRILHDKLKTVFLGHLSQENNYPDLAYESVCAEVTMGDNPYRAKDFDIKVAGRDAISALVEV
jgi:phosphoribosyl 1,2-cyclic phosphodiesterase